MYNILLIGSVGVIVYYFSRKKKTQKITATPTNLPTIKPPKKITNTKSSAKKTSSFKGRMVRGLMKILAKGVKYVVEYAVEYAQEKFAKVVEYALKYKYYIGSVAISVTVATVAAFYFQPARTIGPRFVEEKNGTIIDTLTKLIWLQNTNCVGKKRDWETASKDVEELNEHGTMNNNDCGDISNNVSDNGSHQTDWRLPDLKELQSLLVPPKKLTFSDSDNEFLFPNVMNDYYWSSTLYYDSNNPDTEQAWYIHIDSGDININDKSEQYYVWPVRGNRRWWVENEKK